MWVDNSRIADQSSVVGTSSAQMEAQGTGGSSRRLCRLFYAWYYLTHCLCRVKPNRVEESMEERQVERRTPGPLPREGPGRQEHRLYFSASQTSSKRRFIQWLGWGV